MSLRNVRVGESLLHFTLLQTAAGMDLDAQNDGPPVSLVFAPEIPLGAHELTAWVDLLPVTSSLQFHPQDVHARIEVSLATGVSHLSLRYKGGVAILLAHSPFWSETPAPDRKSWEWRCTKESTA